MMECGRVREAGYGVVSYISIKKFWEQAFWEQAPVCMWEGRQQGVDERRRLTRCLHLLSVSLTFRWFLLAQVRDTLLTLLGC